MIHSHRLGICLFVIALVLSPRAVWGVTFPQADDFQDGSTQGWTDGHGGNNIANIASGGPLGAQDRFLQISSGSFLPVPRLVTFNPAQWAGNYNSAGVSAVAMDLKYLAVGSASDIEPIRIAIFDPNSSTDYGYASSDGVAGGAFTLPNDGAWHHYVFSLSASAMTAIQGGSTPPSGLSTMLSNVPQLRILSSSSPDTSGAAISAQIGVDNVTAVPEPAAWVLFFLGALLLMRQTMKPISPHG